MRKRKMWVGYLFILPSFVGVLLFVLIPYIDVVRRAFMQTASGQFVGLLNFKSILHNKAFLLAFTNTGRFVGVCIPVLLVLSLGIAVSLAKQTAYAEILKTGEVIARRVDVTVEYKGDRYAAVKGLSVNQNIILSSSKQISDGGRIKPQKQ